MKNNATSYVVPKVKKRIYISSKYARNDKSIPAAPDKEIHQYKNWSHFPHSTHFRTVVLSPYF
jgi:hypothetical protein